MNIVCDDHGDECAISYDEDRDDDQNFKKTVMMAMYVEYNDKLLESEQ